MIDPVKKTKKSGEETIWQQFSLFGITLGVVFSYTGVGIALGYYLWKKQGLPWFVLVFFSLLGLTGAIFQLIRVMKRIEKETEGGE